MCSWRKVFLIALFLFVPLFICTQPASAVGLTVTNTNDSGPGSLRQAITEAHGATIYFDPSLKGSTITLLSELSINDKTLTIDGGDNAITISGNGTSRVLKVILSGEKTITLKNLTVTGGSADQGAGLFASGDMNNLNLVNCTFHGNTAADAGGAIFTWSINLNITSCTFSSNSAANTGGAINLTIGVSPTITNCTFSGNSAPNAGGAIYLLSTNPSIANCTFSNNSANTNRGAIWLNSSNPNITNCIMWNNSGGGIASFGSTATVKNSIIEGGYAGTGNMDVNPLLGGFAA